MRRAQPDEAKEETMEKCMYWREVEGMEMDAGFDAGEFSRPDHHRALESLEPCGGCEACLVAQIELIEACAEDGPYGRIV